MANITPFKPGSPPRVREKQRIKITVSHADRITPASAGKTGSEQVFKTQLEDHPRECGKNALAQLSPLVVAGSPPRVREKLYKSY